MAPLALSSDRAVANWLGEEQIDPDIPSALKASRELITRKTDPRRYDADDLPECLHRWATMNAARLARRKTSIYGADVFALGGDAGVLTSDPTLRELVRPYLRPPVGVATLTP